MANIISSVKILRFRNSQNFHISTRRYEKGGAGRYPVNENGLVLLTLAGQHSWLELFVQ